MGFGPRMSFEDWLGFALFWGVPLAVLVISAIGWLA